MRNIKDVQVDRIILHVLNTKVAQDDSSDDKKNEKKGLILSEDIIDLSSNTEAVNFIRDHIKNVLKDKRLRAAKFNKLDAKLPSGLCNELIANPEANFIDASKLLAELLFDVLTDDKRTSPCDLAVCLFHKIGKSRTKYAALLKLDPSSVFENRYKKIDKKRVVDLEKINLVFTSERLQKVALVKKFKSNDVYNLLLLDRQISWKKEVGVAEFFQDSFLDCKLAFDKSYLTKELYFKLIHAENQLRTKGFLSPASDFSNRFERILTANEFHKDILIDELNYPKESIEIIREELDNLPDDNFEIDQDFPTNFLGKVRFIGDHNLKVEIDADFQNRISVEKMTRPNRWVITIQTEKWEKVK